MYGFKRLACLSAPPQIHFLARETERGLLSLWSDRLAWGAFRFFHVGGREEERERAEGDSYRWMKTWEYQENQLVHIIPRFLLLFVVALCMLSTRKRSRCSVCVVWVVGA